jgi:integrase
MPSTLSSLPLRTGRQPFSAPRLGCRSRPSRLTRRAATATWLARCTARRGRSARPVAANPFPVVVPCHRVLAAGGGPRRLCPPGRVSCSTSSAGCWRMKALSPTRRSRRDRCLLRHPVAGGRAGQGVARELSQRPAATGPLARRAAARQPVRHRRSDPAAFCRHARANAARVVAGPLPVDPAPLLPSSVGAWPAEQRPDAEDRHAGEALALPKVLSELQVERLLAAPRATTTARPARPGDARNALCHRPARSELVGLKLHEVNLDMGVVRVFGKGGKERLVPLGEEARDWLRRYLADARPALLEGRQSDDLFVTARGSAMTRQAFWQLIKRYALQAGNGSRPPVTARAAPRFSPPTCSTMAPICASCSSCSAIRTSRRRRSTPTSPANGSRFCTPSTIRVADDGCFSGAAMPGLSSQRLR